MIKQTAGTLDGPLQTLLMKLDPIGENVQMPSSQKLQL